MTIAFRFYKLTQKPLTDLSPTDIDFLIIQKRGLRYLVPMALDTLEEDFFIEADDYNGDLVLNLLRLSDYNNDEYWSNHPVDKLCTHEPTLHIPPKNLRNWYQYVSDSLKKRIFAALNL